MISQMDNKTVLYQESSFRGKYEGIPVIKMEDWLTKKKQEA